MTGRWNITPCSQPKALALAARLGISETTARVLVRRGYADPQAAERFLAGGDPLHDPFRLGDTAAACERIRAAIATKEQICVHGDYDAEGICATALAVLVLLVPAGVRTARLHGNDRRARSDAFERDLRALV